MVDKYQQIEKCIGSKLIFYWTGDAFGVATKVKARFVARGDMQREFVDFADLYEYVPCCDVECSFIGCFCE